MTPRVRPWLRSIEVIHEGPDVVDVHVGMSPDFMPSMSTRCGTMYGPGMFTVSAVGTNVDHYVKFVDLAGKISDVAGPVRPLPPLVTR